MQLSQETEQTLPHVPDALSEIELGMPPGCAGDPDNSWRAAPAAGDNGAGVYDSMGGAAHRGPIMSWRDDAGNASPPPGSARV